MTMRLQQPNSVQGASASMQGGAATVTVYFSDIEEAQDFAAKINRNVGATFLEAAVLLTTPDLSDPTDELPSICKED